MIFLRLFWEFFKTGLFSIGGGMATLPFLSRLADKSGWFTQAQLANMVAVAESTPGPIGINTATYVGFTVAGTPGAVVATLGLITPSILVILLIARFLRAYRDNRFVTNAFYGLRPASMALIASAGLMLVPGALLTNADFGSLGELFAQIKWLAVLLAALVVLVTRVIQPTKKFHPIVWIALSAVWGIAFSL